MDSGADGATGVPGPPGLAAALGFTAEELAANRAGELSGRQIDELRRAASAARPAARRGRLLGGMAVVIVVAIVLARLSGHAGSGLPYVIALVLLVGLLMSQSVFRSGRVMTSMTSMTGGPVSRAEGVARTHPVRPAGAAGDLAAGQDGRDGGAAAARSELTIGGTRFSVSPAVLAAFTDGRAYRAYYAGQGPAAVLLSAEPI